MLASLFRQGGRRAIHQDPASPSEKNSTCPLSPSVNMNLQGCVFGTTVWHGCSLHYVLLYWYAIYPGISNILASNFHSHPDPMQQQPL